jgi:hypothetical protein
LVADSVPRLDTLSVALLEPVSLSNATSPANDSERLLYRNLFDNLIRLDCHGKVRPGLAESWSSESGGWVLTLREGAAFPVLGPMAAFHAASMLRALAFTDTASARALGVDSAFELDDRRLQLVMRNSFRDSVPRFLADPAMVLIDGLASQNGKGERSLAIPQRGSLPAIDFRAELEGDPRDRLDRDIDLVVTRDPTLVDYVSNRPEFAVFPLPWSRTYVLLESGQSGDLASALGASSVRTSLAKDAVRADARAAEPPYWWRNLTACRTASAWQASPTSSRIVYRKDDQVARGLAERIVALASTSPSLRAAGMEAPEFAKAMRDGSERAYILGLPRQSLIPCRDAAAWPAKAQVLPLIDTRAYAIVRDGAPTLTVEWDGTIRIAEP